MIDLSDAALLTKLLSEHDEELSENEREAFSDMADRLVENLHWKLLKKQREWAERVYERLVPQYENLVSSGSVPRGREVPDPPALRHRPLKPPGRS